MKSSLWILLASTALILNGCVKVTSVSGKYKSSSLAAGAGSDAEANAGQDSDDESNGDEGSDDEEASGEESSGEDSSGDESPAEESNDSADAEKGANLLASCKACHTTGGVADKIKLNAALVSKLTNAAPGGDKAASHDSVKTSFSETNRADLEAALNAL